MLLSVLFPGIQQNMRVAGLLRLLCPHREQLKMTCCM